MVVVMTVLPDAFNACRLSGAEWLVCIIIALVNIPIIVLFRIATRCWDNYQSKHTHARVGQDYRTLEKGISVIDIHESRKSKESRESHHNWKVKKSASVGNMLEKRMTRKAKEHSMPTKGSIGKLASYTK
jgi:hypothetical protein